MGSRLDLQLCQRLIKTCCPQLHIEHIIPNTEGWVYFIAEVNGEYIFRFPRSPEANKHLNIEAAILPGIGSWVELPVPQFEFICKKNSDYPWMFVGYPKIPGIPLTKTLLNSTDPNQSAKDLGLFLTQLHSFPVEQARQAKVPFFDSAQWRTLYEKFYQQIKTEIFPVLDIPLQTHLTSLFQKFLENDQNFHFQPTLIHRDLGEEHILWDPSAKRITGIIDWNDVSIGDPFFDFTDIFGSYGEKFTKRVVEHYPRPLDDTIFDRIQFYSKIGWCHCIFYAEMIKDQKLLEESIQQLQSAVIEKERKGPAS